MWKKKLKYWILVISLRHAYVPRKELVIQSYHHRKQYWCEDQLWPLNLDWWNMIDHWWQVWFSWNFIHIYGNAIGFMAQFDPSDALGFLYILWCFGKLRCSYVLRTPRTYVRTTTHVTYVPKGYSGTYLCLSGTYVKVRTYVRHNAPFVRTLYDTCTHYVRTHKSSAHHTIQQEEHLW